MARKDITDEIIVQLLMLHKDSSPRRAFSEFVAEATQQPEKIAYRAIERADKRGLLDFGVSMNYPWITPKGYELLDIYQPTGRQDNGG